MAFVGTVLTDDLHVDQIFTIHYFEYMSDFYFPGERHDFWEFQFVDKGEAEICTDNGTHILSRSQVIFHRPNEFHTLKASGQTAPNIVVVSFSCSSPCMKFFDRKMFTVSASERNLMGLIIAEARRCILTPLDNPYTEKMELRPESLIGSQQLIRMYLEQLLLQMIRRHTVPQLVSSAGKTVDEKKYAESYNKIIFYLEEHIRESLTIDTICRDNLIGRSQLQKMFREQHNCGVIDFFSQMKIEFAKQLIRENQMNFTQISDFLGYSSIHYFSRQFKKASGMTPSEYMSSVKARSERKH